MDKWLTITWKLFKKNTYIYIYIARGNKRSARTFWPNFFETAPGVMDIRAFRSWVSAPTCLFWASLFRGPDQFFDRGRPPEWPLDVCRVSVPQTSSLSCFLVPEHKRVAVSVPTLSGFFENCGWSLAEEKAAKEGLQQGGRGATERWGNGPESFYAPLSLFWNLRRSLETPQNF